MEKLDFTSFENALNSLIDILAMYNQNPNDIVVRDTTRQYNIIATIINKVRKF